MTIRRLTRLRIHRLILNDLTWDEIGRRLAKEDGRRVPYQGAAVIKAYNRTDTPRGKQAREDLAWWLRFTATHTVNDDPLGR